MRKNPDIVRKSLTGRLAAVFAAIGMAGVSLVAVSLPETAQAQFSDRYNFLKAVRDRDGTKATEFIDTPGSGPIIINSRDKGTGETGLHIVIKGRDGRWTGFLLQKGANPNIVDKGGNTPLMLSVLLDYTEGIDWLIKYKADLNYRNRSGETALTRAVQLNRISHVRILLAAGADPDITDNLAGLSPRDYAARDPRKKAILDVIEAEDVKRSKKKDAKPQGELDFSGIG